MRNPHHNSGNEPGAQGRTPDGAIDVGVLLDRCMDDQALALLVLAKFEEQAADNVSGLTRSMDANRTEDAAKRAHALRGTAGAIGAGPLMNIAARLEEASLRSEAAEMDSSLEALKHEVDRCLAELPRIRRAFAARDASGPAV